MQGIGMDGDGPEACSLYLWMYYVELMQFFFLIETTSCCIEHDHACFAIRFYFEKLINAKIRF